MTRELWNSLSVQSRQLWLMEYYTANSLPAARPEIVPVIIPVVGNDVTITDLLVNYQLFRIVGFTAAGARSRGTTLAALVASIAGGTFDEKNYIDEAILNTAVFNSPQLIYGLMQSEDIVITLNGGHGLSELHFYCLPATYLEQSVSDFNLFS